MEEEIKLQKENNGRWKYVVKIRMLSSYRMHQIEELAEKERVANESIEGLMMDIAAAEEEITRWKVAAEDEAAAGRAVEQEFVARVKCLY
ncbi:hypothetical protein FEM48_Zijuj10G0054100 [Ziziphus jujuba var. spinosa]|uniref:Uncharacterized protein n=1 Tax=Ziziphus jujuba var. spinosa TaxID=714518 RepID=A0A978ULJ6_ZIZJJ|nr:hypothetical protein FEM48_Zijuj10G0054100 [Ziziphus jujuba var. spinosa]